MGGDGIGNGIAFDRRTFAAAPVVGGVVQDAPLLVVAFDDLGRVVAWNRACERATGWSAEEVLGSASVAAEVEALLARDRVVEWPLASRPGGASHAGDRVISWTPMGARMPVRGWATWAVGVDVTDLRNTERELRESEERWRTVVESSPVGICVHAEGIIRFANPAALRMVGAPDLSHVLGMPVLDLVHRDYRAVASARVERIYGEHGDTAPMEQVFLRLDGEPIEVEVLATAVRWDGRPASQVVFTDITERRRAEAEQARLEDQLRHAQRLESVGRLAGGVAHDFNNILTIIQGYLELIGQRLGTAHPVQREIEEVLRAAERGGDLTRQLLAFSRRQASTPRVVDPVEVVTRSQRLIERLLGEDVRLRLEYDRAGETPEGRDGPSPVPNVRVDPGQLEQVLVNLVVNARDAMPSGGTLTIAVEAVHVAGEQEMPDGRYVRLEIRDTGHGMDEETLSRACEPFFTTKEHGTGLGMSTVYGIVRQNQGFLALDSRVGGGTVVQVHLPITQETLELERPPRTSPRSGQGSVLLVEDEPVVRRLVETVLERHGYRVHVATDGHDALARFGSPAAAGGEPIDLLLTDVVMPGLNGRELYEALSEVRPALQVLFMSGYTADVIALHGVSEDGRFLHKPFTLDDLLDRVGALVDPVNRDPARREHEA